MEWDCDVMQVQMTCEGAIMTGCDMEGGLEMPESAPEYPDWIPETSFDLLIGVAMLQHSNGC